MKKRLFSLLFSIIAVLGTIMPCFAAENPTSGDGKWYYIKSQRGPSATNCWWTVGSDGYLVAGALAKTEAQMFTLVEASAGNVTFNNKGTGFTMSYDPAGGRKHMKFVGTTPVSTGWTLTSNVVNGIQGWSFPGEEVGLHQSSGPAEPDYFRIMASWYVLSDHCTFFFYEATADIDLKIAIESAEILHDGAVIGVLPGTYPPAVKSILADAITSAKNVLGSTEPTTINDAIDALNAAISAFQSSKVKLAGATPVVNDGKWYYVKSQRGTSPYFWTYTSTGVKTGALNKNDANKFTLVSTTSGKVTIKNYEGNKMKVDGTFSADGTSNGWTLTSQPTIVAGVQGWSFPGESSGLHSYNSGGNELRAGGWYVLSDHCTFFFYEATDDIDLQLKIEEASKIVVSAVAGETPGSIPQSAIDALGGAIGIANATLGSTDAATISAAVQALSSAIATFNASKVPLVEASTESAPKWYLIKNTGRGGMGSTLFVSGFNAQLSVTTVANSIPADGSGTGSSAASLAHLFRFEIDANGKYRIVNALYPDGEMLQAASGGNSSQAIKYGTKTSPSTVWSLNSLGLSNAKYQFNMISDNSTNCHADGSLKLVSWSSGANDASAWYVEEYTGVVSELYQVTFNAANSKFDAVKTLLPAGEEFFKATPDGLSALEAAQQRLSDAYNNGEPTPDFNPAVVAVDAAVDAYWATLQFPFSTKDEPYWCVLQTVGTNANVFDALMSKEANTGLLRGILPAEVPNDVLQPTTLFRFEKDPETGKVAIINRDGTSVTTEGYATSFMFADVENPFYGWEILKEKSSNHIFGFQSGPGASINITNSTGAAVRYYTNYFAGGIADKGNQFKIYPYDTYFRIPVSNIETKVSIRPIVVNGAITVGDHNVEVYSATGVKLKNKDLKVGVYVAKVAGQTYKVIVK